MNRQIGYLRPTKKWNNKIKFKSSRFLILGTLTLFFLAVANDIFGALFSSVDGRNLYVVNGISESVDGMPERPKNLKGKTYSTCDDEREYEVDRDKYFEPLTPETIPRPFPVDTVPIEILTEQNAKVLLFLENTKT